MDKNRNEEVRRIKIWNRKGTGEWSVSGSGENSSLPYGQKGVDVGSKWRAGTELTEVGLDGWRDKRKIGLSGEL